jgi:hypothetical protein
MVVKRRQQPRAYNSWIGSPLSSGNKFGSNKPHNFFKTNKNDYPARMFGDKDRDGVANVFDCKPNNPNKQGLIDAIVGGVKGVFTGGKGSIRKGWSEGMATTPASRRQARIRRFATTQEEKARSSLPGQQSSYERFKAQENSRVPKERYRKVLQAQNNIEKGIAKAGSYLPTSKTGKGTYSLAKAVMNPREYQMDLINRIRTGHLTRLQKEKMAMVKKAARYVFPVIPAGVTAAVHGAQSRAGEMHARGRPKGSLDPRYQQYGGVMGYRRAMSQQRRAFREQLRQQQEMIKQQKKMQQMPQYEAQQYNQQTQVPQEVQGATPDYSQFQQMQMQQEMQGQQVPQPQYQQVQQLPRQPYPQDEVVPVFRSSGGKPYPADRRPLAPPRETVPTGFVESVDLFTSKRFLKKLPQAERWQQ